MRQRKVEDEYIPTDKLLGSYFPDDQLIKLYIKEIKEIADKLKVPMEVLMQVVKLHEAVHAVVHLGKDADGGNFAIKDFNAVDNGIDPSPLHETLAQLITYHLCRSNNALYDCFDKLNRRQPPAYKHWD